MIKAVAIFQLNDHNQNAKINWRKHSFLPMTFHEHSKGLPFHEILKDQESTITQPIVQREPPVQELDQKNFWELLMKSEGRDKTYKILEKNYGSRDGITTKLSDGTVISLKKNINLTDFTIISSMWNLYK